MNLEPVMTCDPVKTNKVILIGYHANCNDGLMAAAIAYYSLMHEDRLIEFMTMDYTEKSEELFALRAARLADIIPTDTEICVYVVDYCPKANCLSKLSSMLADHSLSYVSILDHHATAIAKLAVNNQHPDFSYINFVYEETMSGAGIAWSHFFPAKPMPNFVAYVQDRDLWRWEFGDKSKQFHAFTRMIKPTPEVWMQNFLGQFGVSDEAVLNKGAELVAGDELFKAGIIAQSKRLLVQMPQRSGTINAAIFECKRKDLVSEISHELLQQGDIDVALCFTPQLEGGYVWSVRSKEESTVSAKDLALSYGGGGHEFAAGFKTSTMLEVLI